MAQILDPRSVLAVRDLDSSTRYYMDVLGFTRDFGDGSDGWSFLSRGKFKVMLGDCADATPAGELGDHSYFAYVLVDGVDELYKELAGKNAGINSALATKPWGLREFGVQTPDGHRMTFGEPTAARKQGAHS
ncbi:MAG: glyoxalase superfamily protein [Gemmatimonadaceae bacterium]